jgi:type IV secretion system protein VirD4
MSIYVGVNPDDLHRLRPVLSLFFQQAIGLQTRTLPEHDPALAHQVLMLLDECAALGRIPILAESLSYLPGYNVRVALVIHTPAQLREIYGTNAAETMLKSLAARIVFAAKDYSDAREISDELGTTTVRVKSVSRAAPGLFEARRPKSSNISCTERPRALLLPQEVQALGQDDAIVFYEGLRPIHCKKLRYFSDRRFRARLLKAPGSAGPSRAETFSSLASATSAPDESANSGAHTRDATSQDIERIHSLTLEDLAVDLEPLVPRRQAAGERMTPEELDKAVDRFIASFRGSGSASGRSR